MPTIFIRERWIYPVKSLGGVRVDEARITSAGSLALDREWIVVDARGKMVWQGDIARMTVVRVSLDHRAGVLAAHLSHGEKRALELAIALAMQPKLLLLDEPMAGTGPEESERLIVVLRRLKGRFAMMLVEHDMNAVFALADRISVLTYGRILASGAPDAVRSDPAVIAAYLGEELE